MSVRPYRRTPPRRAVGLLQPTRRVLLEDGRRVKVSAVPAGTVIYADRDEAGRFITAGQGEVVCWNGKMIRWRTPEGPEVILFDHFPSDDEGMAGLVGWRDWLGDHGASVGSVGHAAYSLLRATITRGIRTNCGDAPPLREVVGGRQSGLPPGRYGAFECWDITAAYARAMGTMVYPGTWVELRRPTSPQGWPIPVLARARVHLPRALAWGPLPRRRNAAPSSPYLRRMGERVYPCGPPTDSGRLEGIWTGEELAAAEAVGARVTYLRVWVQPTSTPRRPFLPWWRVIEAGRDSLEGWAQTLAKRTGNALWGQFIMLGTKTVRTYTGGEWAESTVHAGSRPAALDIPELVASAVRTRLYAEFIAPNADRIISVHTDGGLILCEPSKSPPPTSWPPPAGSGNPIISRSPAPGTSAPGAISQTPDGPSPRPVPTHATDWKMKDRGDRLRYLGPQAYAFRREGERSTSYVFSGVRPEEAPRFFRALEAEVMRRG